MKRRLVLGAAGVFVLVALLTAAVAWRRWTAPAPRAVAGDTLLVRIPAGMTLTAAADTLVARGLLDDRRVLLVGARLRGRSRDLRAGLYALPSTASPRELLDALVSGRGVQVRLTIPEGLEAGEVADLVAAGLGCDRSAFLAAADSLTRVALAGGVHPAGRRGTARLDSLLAEATDGSARRLHLCEGYLAPDTYLFAADAGARTVARHLVATQLARLDSAVSRAVPPGRPAHELLVLASIVESEARREDERTRIAAVYANRLARGWRLEADPTVAYVLGKKGQRLFYRDLAVDSAWNTYRRSGLPPGAIGNPGLASLLAAAAPDTTCDALFFVADGADGHVFSRTASEHEEAVRRFRALRGAERRRQTD